METPTLHMHTIKVAVLEPAPGVDYSIERVKADLRERLHLLPPFRRRVIEVPLGLHHPVWIEDPTFDIDRHVCHAIVPSPGGPRELDSVISLIASAPLDRRCPLWELWFVEGLSGGRGRSGRGRPPRQRDGAGPERPRRTGAGGTLDAGARPIAHAAAARRDPR